MHNACGERAITGGVGRRIFSASLGRNSYDLDSDTRLAEETTVLEENYTVRRHDNTQVVSIGGTNGDFDWV